MNDLLNKKCVPCEGGIIPFDISEIHKYQKKVDGWDIFKNKKNVYFLEKKFNFDNFVKSQKFVNKVGDIAEHNGESKHQPFVSSKEDCICIISTDGPLIFNNYLANKLQSFIRI